MQREYASAFWVFVDWLPADAAAGRAKAAAAMIANALRALGRDARHSRRTTRMLSFMTPPLGSMIVLATFAMPTIHTLGRVTSPLPAMLDGCHVDLRVQVR
jgi:hypothetical protein